MSVAKMMRYRVLVGSAIAILLLGTSAALIFRHGGNTPAEDASRQSAAISQGGSAVTPADAAKPNPPTQPSITPPSFDIVKVAPDGSTVIAGRAEPGSKVIVRDGDSVIGEVTADPRGEWVLVPQKPIPPGDRLLSLEASNPQGGAAVTSNETVALSIPPTGAGGKGETALAVVLPRDGAGTARVLQRPDSAGPAPADKSNALSMDTIEYDAQGRVVLSGRATPNASLQIYLGNELAATVTADSTGRWTATSAGSAGHKPLELRVDQLAEDGRVAQRLALPLTQPAAVQLASGQEYVVRPGNSLWQIARRTYGAGTRYLMIYSANLAQIKDPERIYPGQVFKLPKS
jgi:nucleoid-associated protein YgaU